MNSVCLAACTATLLAILFPSGAVAEEVRPHIEFEHDYQKKRQLRRSGDNGRNLNNSFFNDMQRRCVINVVACYNVAHGSSVMS